MRQVIVSGANVSGEFTFISGLSNAAQNVGMTREGLTGAKWWSFDSGDSKRSVRDSFADCLINGAEQVAMTTSNIGGVTEHWENRLIRSPEPTYVVAIAREVFPGKTPAVTIPEMRVLTGLCDDLSTTEIAEAHGMTLAAVHSRIYRLREKFHVATTHGLVAAAIRYGVIRRA